MKRALLACIAFAALCLAPPPQASALICLPLTGCFCTVSATDIDVPDFSPLSGATQDAEGEISINCSGLAIAPSVDISLDDGLWGSFADRKMRNGGGDLLSYNIYTTNQHTTIWGDGTSGASIITLSGGLLVANGWSRTRSMFARAAPQSTTKPGDYSDTVVVRIDF